MLTGPTPIEGVKRTNIVIVYSNQRTGFALYNLYTIDVDQESRNCYSCKEFGYLAKNYRNKGIRSRIGKDKKLKYR